MEELRKEKEMKVTENLIRAVREFLSELWCQGDASAYDILKNTFELTDEQMKKAAPDFWKDLKDECGWK